MIAISKAKKVKTGFRETSKGNYGSEESPCDERKEEKRMTTFRDAVLSRIVDEHMVDLGEEDKSIISDDNQVEEDDDGPWFPGNISSRDGGSMKSMANMRNH